MMSKSETPMRTVLEFNLPEEENDLHLALNGARYKAVIEGLDRKLRDLIKYEGKDLIETQAVRDMIHSLLDEYGIKIYE